MSKRYLNKKLAFYEITDKYLKYIKRFEDKVPNLKYETREKLCAELY